MYGDEELVPFGPPKDFVEPAADDRDDRAM
jgi:hypothetical protein